MTIWQKLRYILTGHSSPAPAQAKPEPNIVSHKDSDPFPGHKILDLAYPNHAENSPELKPDQIATGMAREMDVHLFVDDPAFAEFGVTATERLQDPEEDIVSFCFGPIDDATGELAKYHRAVVRETAGGGMMLLQQETGLDAAGALRAVFRKVIADLSGSAKP